MGASFIAQLLKNLPAMQETWVQFLGRKDPLKKEMATHSSTLAWKIPWPEEPGRLQFMWSQRVGHNWVTSLSLSQFWISQLSMFGSVASWPTYRFLRRWVRWSGIPISLIIFQFVVIHIAKGFSVVNEAEVDVFLEFSCFFCDPTDVGNLISASSAFSKFSLNIWKFLVHILLKPGLKDFEHYLAIMWNECGCAVVWTFFEYRDWNENWPVQKCGE